MFKYKIYNTPDTIKPKTSIIKDVFLIINENIEKVQKGRLNIIFESDEIIKSLNKEYRWKDKTTDVLSFHYFDDFNCLKDNEICWEIIISENELIKNAKENELMIEEEFYKILIHSTLHILWFDHENEDDYEIMKNKENLIVNKLNEKYKLKID